MTSSMCASRDKLILPLSTIYRLVSKTIGYCFTLARTHSISGLKILSLEIDNFELKIKCIVNLTLPKKPINQERTVLIYTVYLSLKHPLPTRCHFTNYMVAESYPIY